MMTAREGRLEQAEQASQGLGIDLGGVFQRDGVGQDVEARGVPGHRPLEQGQVEAVDVLDHVEQGVVGDDVEAGVDRAEHQVEVEEDGLVLVTGGQGGGEVDRQRGAADAAGRPGDGDDLRALDGG